MGVCISTNKDEAELAAQVLGKTKANAKNVRRLSTHNTDGVWVTRQTSDIRKVFKFGKQINKGQFGVIYVVTNAAGETFACKQISKKKLTGATSIRDIRREIEIMHHLRGHPNVITLHGAYEDATDVYLVMELCMGGDLFEKIETIVTITERSAAAMFRGLVETVSYCHTLGVLHRDLKPENFFITDRGPDAVVKLADFGLSCFFKEGQTYKDVVGSAYYMAPEVLAREYDKACDVWSLGVILHILLAGAPPFTGPSDAEVMKAVKTKELDLSAKPWPSISRHARHLVSHMLEKDPERRLRMDQVLTHPWLRPDGTAPPRAIPSGVRDRMNAFRSLNGFKREARRILASALPPEEVAGLKMLFEDLDADGDGMISLADLRAGLARKGEELGGEEAAALLRTADLNGDGFIDYREFVASTYTLSKMEQNESLLKAFQHFDLNGDNFISVEELGSVLANLPASGRESIAQLLAEADLNRDGRIDYKEFCAMLLNASPKVGQAPELLLQVAQSGGLGGSTRGAPSKQHSSGKLAWGATTSVGPTSPTGRPVVTLASVADEDDGAGRGGAGSTRGDRSVRGTGGERSVRMGGSRRGSAAGSRHGGGSVGGGGEGSKHDSSSGNEKSMRGGVPRSGYRVVAPEEE